MANKKRNKNNANADADAKPVTKEKGRGGMRDKQEKKKNENSEELNSSPEWGREVNKPSAIREADDVAETSKEPIEPIETAEQTQQVVASEQVKNNSQEGEPSQQECVVDKTDLPSTTQDGPHASDVFSDTPAKKEAPVAAWSFDGEGFQDVTGSRDNLSNELRQLSIGEQPSQENLEGARKESDKEENMMVPTDDSICHSKLQVATVPREHSGREPSVPPKLDQESSQLPSERPVDEPKIIIRSLSSKSNSSSALPTQEPTFHSRLTPPLQGVPKHPTTARLASRNPQLASKLRPPTRDQSIQTHASTEQQLSSKPKIRTRDYGTQTEAPTPQLRGILNRTNTTTPTSTEPQVQEKKLRPEPSLRGILKWPNQDHSLGRIVSGEGPEPGVRIAPPVASLPRPVLSNPIRQNPVRLNPVPPPTPRPNQAISKYTLPILRLIVNNATHELVANREHILATNTTYFSANTREDTDSAAGRAFGRYVNFSGKQFSHEVIKEYSIYLYDGVIPTMTNLGRLTPTRAAQTLNFLDRAYIFGEHINDKRWMNYIMDAFISVHIRDWRFDMDDVVYYTYEFTKYGSPLRRLLVDMQAYCLTSHDNLKVRFRDLPAEFSFDITVALNDLRYATSSDWRERLNNPEAYHV